MCSQDYPARPFFLRVVTPRCVWYTGHVTAGGSICIETLTLSGGPNGWTSALCVESVLNLVITNMCARLPPCSVSANYIVPSSELTFRSFTRSADVCWESRQPVKGCPSWAANPTVDMNGIGFKQ